MADNTLAMAFSQWGTCWVKKARGRIICFFLNGQPIRILQSLDIEQRNKIIKQIKGIVGATQRQIARVIGIHQSIIFFCGTQGPIEVPDVYSSSGIPEKLTVRTGRAMFLDDM